MNPKFTRALRAIFSTALLCVALCGSLVAQEITATLVGTVRDANGAVVPGATVTLRDPAKNNNVVRTVTTNEDGEYNFPAIDVSTYDITVEAPNFKKNATNGIKVDVGSRRTLDISLEAGNIAEIVTVEAGAASVDLQSATSSTVISGTQARELSLNNRNWVQLVALSPGVSSNLDDQVYVGTTNPSGQANTINLSVNGARSSQNTFTVDGADITDRGSNITIQAYPSVDSIGEFTIQRSLFPAESGRSGGGQVNIITRSGTSDFHGSLFEFVRNEKFNANGFMENQIRPAGGGDAIRAPFRYNNFGGTIGGPVYFFNFNPNSNKVVKRWDRTFFFFSSEFRKDIRYPLLSSTVPDALLRSGRFTVPICLRAVQLVTPANTFTCDPAIVGVGGATAQVLPAGSPIPAINPVAQQYVNQIYNNLPLPNQANFTLASTALNTSDFRQEILKIDHSVNDKWSMYYRFQQDKIPTEDVNSLFSSGSGLPGVATTSTNSPGKAHTFQSTYVINPNLIVLGRYTYGYGAILSENVGLLSNTRTTITSALPYNVTRDRVPSVTGNGFSNLQSFGPYDNFSNKQNMEGSLTWIAGSHTMKYGAIYSQYRKNENALAGNNEGIFSAFNTPGSNAATIVSGTGGTGNTIQQQWANFLLGTNATLTQAAFDYTADLRQMTFEAYAQDEWRARKNLTFYFGVRYSFFGSPWDKNGRLTNFVSDLWTRTAAPDVAGNSSRIVAAGKNWCNGIIANTQNYQTSANCTPIQSPYGKFVINAPKTDFAPRFGVAWDPFGDGTTSIRAGYGIYHDQVLNGTMLQHIGTNPPYQITCIVSGINIANPTPAGCTPTASATVPNIRAVQADWKTPYMQHWSGDIQRQITKDTLISVGYYGSKGTNLIGAFELNEIPAGYARTLGATGCAATGSATTTGTTWCQEPGKVFLSAATNNILDQIRPYEGYRSITMIQPRYNSNYHSMQVSAVHRFTGGSQITAAYTWSKNLTDNQTDRSTAPQDSYNTKGDWGRATLDRRHMFITNYVYELPWYKDQKGLKGKLLGGYQISGIGTYYTGIPFTVVTSNYDPAGLGFISAAVAGGRSNVLCDPNASAPGTQQVYFNVNCFQNNPTTAENNVGGLSNAIANGGRGIINGPRLFKIDFSLMKNFRFGESVRLQLRAETFNIFNTVNFRTLSLNRTAANFGAVLTARDPRTMQFSAKFYF